MAAVTFKQKVLDGCKRLGPLYRGARNVRRLARRIFYAALRRYLPAWPRLGPAKGLFSAYAELCAGHLPGEVLLPGQSVPPVPAGSLRLRARLGQEGHQPWPVFWTRHANARLIGDTALLLDDRKRACAEALYQIHQDGSADYHTLWLPPPQRLAGNWTSVRYRWDANYYHWLTDCLPRLALLDRLPPDTKILVPARLHPFHRETLEWLGLADRVQGAPGRHLLVENYFFSAPTAMTGCPNPYAVNFLRGRFLPRAAAPPFAAEKIYICRRGTTRGLQNEPAVLAFLAARGWQAVELETLTLAQQIGLFANARAVCGLHGAGFTNLLWCRPGCVAVELLADNFLNGCYESLASCVAVEHRFLIQPADELQRIRVDIKQLARLLPD
jgi:capsular polysaccharide biosynthesis protein